MHSYADTFFGDEPQGDEVLLDGDTEMSLLAQELKFLQEHRGKVYPQSIGPVVTKDLADCIMELTSRLLRDALERHNQWLLANTQPAFGGQGGYTPQDLARQGGLATSAHTLGSQRGTLRDQLSSAQRGSRFSQSPRPGGRGRR